MNLQQQDPQIYKIIEKEIVAGKTKRAKKEEIKERLQPFEGTVIAIKAGDNSTFTVRRIASRGIGMERIFPVASPWVKKIVIKKQGRVRRAKLYYLRQKIGKDINRIKTPDNPPVEKVDVQK